MDKYASVITVEFNDYFKGVRTFFCNGGFIKLCKNQAYTKGPDRTIDAAAGGAVTLPNSSIVTLNANSVAVKATGLAYTGVINVYAADIDPTRF
jgi:hypothetical protein